MKWPWVSRAHYELLEHNCGELRAAAHDGQVREAAWVAAFNNVFDKYHALKLQGAVIVEPSAPIERKEQDEVTRRINILSVGRPGLRAQMLRQVESDRKLLGLDDVAIMARMEAGVAVSDEGVIA